MDYRQEVLRTVRLELEPQALMDNAALGLAGEAGEVLSLISPHDYLGSHKISDSLKKEFIKELGDVNWYLEVLGHILDQSWLVPDPVYLASRLTSSLGSQVNGLVVEASKITDLVKKNIYHNKPLDHNLNDLAQELWVSIQVVALLIDSNLREIQLTNIKKLRQRYPQGFNSQDAQLRKDEK